MATIDQLTAGTTVKFIPRGGKRTVTVILDHAEEIDGWVALNGMIPSRKWEGDFIGRKSAYLPLSDITVVA